MLQDLLKETEGVAGAAENVGGLKESVSSQDLGNPQESVLLRGLVVLLVVVPYGWTYPDDGEKLVCDDFGMKVVVGLDLIHVPLPYSGVGSAWSDAAELELVVAVTDDAVVVEVMGVVSAAVVAAVVAEELDVVAGCGDADSVDVELARCHEGCWLGGMDEVVEPVDEVVQIV